MYKIIKNNLILATITIFIASIPATVFGAQLSFELSPNQSPDGQATVVDVRMDPQSKLLNVVEGVIVFEGAISDEVSVGIETDGSVLTIWPTPPNYFSQEKAVRFTGGVPGGFNQTGLLFRLRMSSPVSGEVKINWVNGAAYLNDGEGTKEPVFSKSMKVNLTGENLRVSNNNTVNKVSLEIDWLKYVIIVLAIIVVSFFIFYVFNKKNK
jgi:hypothetical protein